MKNLKNILGFILVFLGSYSTVFVLLLLFSGIISHVDQELYESLRRVMSHYMPRLIPSVVWAEVAGLLLVIVGFCRPSWRVWRNRLWLTGILQISFVAFLIVLKALAWLIFFYSSLR